MLSGEINSGLARKRVVIGGGSGFVGRALTSFLRARGDRVTWVSRTPGPDRLTWADIQQYGLPECDAVINLAGKHILDMRRFWTKRYREEVIASRIRTTAILVDAINASSRPPEVFLSSAGKCFYGSQAFRQPELYGDMDEYSQPVGIDFPAELVSLWEDAANAVDKDKVRHVQIRLGIVLGAEPNGGKREWSLKNLGAYGIFPLLRGSFQRGLCFGMGSGVQPFPWVHIDDVVGIFIRAIDDPKMRGIFNAVSPGILSNREFSEQLARSLNRGFRGQLPSWMIKSAVGLERSTILLLGQRVRPTRTLQFGYQFKYQTIGDCLQNLLDSKPQEVAA